MKLRSLCAATLALSLLFPPGCDLLPDDGSGTTVDLGECVAGPLSISVPAVVFCHVTSIAATISGPDMTTIDVSIDKDNPSATLTIPSGPDRELVVKIYTADNPDKPFITSKTYVFCVGDLEPVTVAVDVTLKNRAPEIGAISPSGGELTPGEAVSLSVLALDPDACDGVKSFSWSTDFGSIAESGNKAARASFGSSTATWTPACPDKKSCEATVTVTASDERGGTDSAQATYQIAAVKPPPEPAAAVNHAPTVTLSKPSTAGSVYCGPHMSTIVSVTATATDPDGDSMSYAWTILPDPDAVINELDSALVLSAGDTVAEWEYCCTACSDTVEVTVTDSHGASVTGSIVVP